MEHYLPPKDTMEGVTIIKKRCYKCHQYKNTGGGKIDPITKKFKCKECVNASRSV